MYKKIMVPFGVCLILILAALPFMAACAAPTPAPAPAPAPAPKPAPAPAPAPKPAPVPAPAPKDETSLAQTTKPEPVPNHDTDNELMEPVLLDTLKRNCQVTRGSDNFDQIGLAVGETAVNFTLKDINGGELRLSQLLAEKPVLVIFGSFT